MLSPALLIDIKVSASLSILGSGYIIYDGLRNNRKNLEYVRNRVMFGLSCCDIIYSFISPFLGTWMLLKDAELGLAGATVGTQATCDFQGFIDVLLGRGSVCYNSALAVTYLLMVRYQVTERTLCKYEPLIHLIPLTIGLGLAIPPFPLQAYNWAGHWGCWIAPAPLGCHADDSDTECIRGDSDAVQIFGLITSAVVSWSNNFIIATCMFLLFWTVLQRERGGDRFVYNGELNRKQSRKVAVQGMLYVLAYTITWVFDATRAILFWMGSDVPQWLYAASNFFIPLQGLFNALVYLRPIMVKRIRNQSVKFSFVGRPPSNILKSTIIATSVGRDDTSSAGLDDTTTSVAGSTNLAGTAASSGALSLYDINEEEEEAKVEEEEINVAGEEAKVKEEINVDEEEATKVKEEINVDEEEATKVEEEEEIKVDEEEAKVKEEINLEE